MDDPARALPPLASRTLAALLALAIVAVLLGGILALTALLTRRAPDALPALAPPPTAPVPADPAARAAWADAVAARTGIPVRAVAAYGVAEVRARDTTGDTTGDCGFTWVTLAGLGRVESDHGRSGGAALADDGRPDPPVLGVALDGTRGNRDVRDTDGGRLDGDTVHDRAVGPLQFIPSTWALVGVDADGDGRADPQDVDDAAAAAASYLCAGPSGEAERDLRRGDDWRAAVLSYNNSAAYVARVRAEVTTTAGRLT